jgi:hypothetical protein
MANDKDWYPPTSCHVLIAGSRLFYIDDETRARIEGMLDREHLDEFDSIIRFKDVIGSDCITRLSQVECMESLNLDIASHDRQMRQMYQDDPDKPDWLP